MVFICPSIHIYGHSGIKIEQKVQLVSCIYQLAFWVFSIDQRAWKLIFPFFPSFWSIFCQLFKIEHTVGALKLRKMVRKSPKLIQNGKNNLINLCSAICIIIQQYLQAFRTSTFIIYKLINTSKFFIFIDFRTFCPFRNKVRKIFWAFVAYVNLLYLDYKYYYKM